MAPCGFERSVKEESMGEEFREQRMRRPIRIVGGGLAGLSLGVGLLRRGVEVTVCEAGRYPRHRVCGEFLSGVGRETLRDLGIDHLLDGAVLCRETSWFRGDREVMRRELPEAAWGISRHLLDARLADELRRLGGTLCEGERRSPSGEVGEVVALGRRRASGNWVGIKMHFEGLEMASDLEMHLGRNCYLGLARIEAGRVNVCGLFRGVPSRPRDLAGACRERGLGALARRMDEAVEDSGSFSSVVGLGFGWQSHRGGAGRNSGNGSLKTETEAGIRVGDHLAVIPPFSGNGMAMALEGAALALDPLAGYAGGDRSWQEACAVFDEGAKKRFRRRLGVAGGLHPLLVGGAGQRLLVGMVQLSQLPFQAFYRLLRP